MSASNGKAAHFTKPFVAVPLEALGDLKARELAALVALERFASRAGSCRVGHQELARAAGMSVATLKLALAALAERGYLEEIRRTGRSSQYVLAGPADLTAVSRIPANGTGRDSRNPANAIAESQPSTEVDGGEVDTPTPRKSEPLNGAGRRVRRVSRDSANSRTRADSAELAAFINRPAGTSFDRPAGGIS